MVDRPQISWKENMGAPQIPPSVTVPSSLTLARYAERDRLIELDKRMQLSALALATNLSRKGGPYTYPPDVPLSTVRTYLVSNDRGNDRGVVKTLLRIEGKNGRDERVITLVFLVSSDQAGDKRSNVIIIDKVPRSDSTTTDITYKPIAKGKRRIRKIYTDSGSPSFLAITVLPQGTRVEDATGVDGKKVIKLQFDGNDLVVFRSADAYFSKIARRRRGKRKKLLAGFEGAEHNLDILKAYLKTA